ncbi:PRA1 family protein B4 [Tetrabaena socialis]|uniref:PRA1 family protein n=1 Tax=Tetrabaena socialis TaxID=47790 RepID=A0A2J8AA88_9CHLO|nr:PRA1 family protein B4 [Tetrabaena socialis]|eukprot:PNH09446.1 PRA1 family protein B4 [Tetrabaena socialis]
MAQMGAASGGNPAASTGAMAVIVTRLKDYAGGVLAQRKPWNEVVDRNSFSKPNTIAEAASRIRKNATYFKVNYLIAMLLTTAVTFVMNPTALLVLALLMGSWIYVFIVRTGPLVIGGRTISDREKLLGMSAASFIVIFFLTSVGTVFFSALSLSLAVVVAHGALREPDNLFIDEGETQTGLFNIFAVPPAAATTTV